MSAGGRRINRTLSRERQIPRVSFPEGSPSVAVLLRPIALLALLSAASAAAAPLVPARLLLELERDLGGAMTQVETIRTTSSDDVPEGSPAALLGIADGSPQARMAVVETTVRAIRRRLYDLDAAVQEIGDARLEQILFIMSRELDRLVAALATARDAPDAATRRAALAKVEDGLVQLDGATAALWTFD